MRNIGALCLFLASLLINSTPGLGQETTYVILVETGDVSLASTNAQVSITLNGTEGTSSKIRLNTRADQFEQGKNDTFEVKIPNLGQLTNLKVEHDNSGPAPGWFLNRITVYERNRPSQIWHFPNYKWISLGAPDGNHLSRVLTAVRGTTPVPGCSCDHKIDFGFLLDGSGSVTLANFQKMLQFTKDLVSEFTISSNMAHAGVVVYGQTANVIFDFNKYYDKQTMLNVIGQIQYPSATATNTGHGLTITRNNLYQTSARAGVPQYLILVTDGDSNDDVTAPSNLLKNDGVVIFSVGVGNVNKAQLDLMSSDPDSVHTLVLSNFDALNSIVDIIKNRVCQSVNTPAPPPPPPPPTTPPTDHCKPNPCKNDGTCKSGEDGPTCVCVYGFKGNTCDEKEPPRPRSCLDLRKQGIKTNGFYEIYDASGRDPCQPTKVYCDMTSEPCMVWTLIESWTKGNRSLPAFRTSVYSVDSPVNYDAPSWYAYRMTHYQMNSLKKCSTHWRATCSFPKYGVDYRDYVRGNFKDFDIMTYIGNNQCKKVDYVNVRGHKSSNTDVPFFQATGAYILHIQSTGTHCSFKMNQGAVGSEDNFGYYVSPNPKFRCTATDADTTQWWFGAAYPDFCHPNPCLNGGTCSNGKTNYTCTCPKGYTGDICQHTKPKSCVDLRKQGVRTNGYYEIYDDSGPDPCEPTKVYCDMTSEPCMAWTLVESWSTGNKTLAPFRRGVFSEDSPLNYDNPNWPAYRMTHNQMDSLKSRSSHWRSTCSFPKHGVDHRDYVRGNFKDFDIMTYLGNGVCKAVDYVNIRGHQARQSQAAFWQTKNTYHLHIDSSAAHCAFKPNQGAVGSEDNFGFYLSPNPKFRCTATDVDTTQWWFGGYNEDKPKSCVDIRKIGFTTNGHYQIYVGAGPSPCQPTTVYCDMTSEPCMAWTLVESWSTGNRTLPAFRSAVYSVDARVNFENPNWSAYRMTLTQMNLLKGRSTHWRSTCSFPKHGVDYTDYVRGNFEDFDIMTYIGSGACKLVDYINIRGHNAKHIQAAFWQARNALHLHIDSSAAHCAFKPNQGAVGSEDNFGYYGTTNPKFRCTATDTDTTQWWFGGRFEE